MARLLTFPEHLQIKVPLGTLLALEKLRRSEETTQDAIRRVLAEAIQHEQKKKT